MPLRGTAIASLEVAVAAACFGAISTFVVLGTRGAGAPTLEGLLLWRYLLAAAGLLPCVVAAARPSRLARFGGARALPAALALGGLGQAAVAFLSLSALRWISVGTLGFLFYTFPAWVALFAALRGSERLDRRRLAALALSLVGIACTIGLGGAGSGAGAGPATGAAPWPGIALALGAAIVYALYIPYLGRLQARATPAGAAALVSAGAAVVLALAIVARGGLPPVAMPARSWLAAAALALLCTVFAFQLFMDGLSRLGAVRTAIVSTVEPFCTAVLGAVVLAQPLTGGTLLGGALIAGAVLLLQPLPKGPPPPGR